MKRGDMYLLRHPGGGDPKKQRVMTVVSRQTVVDSRFPTVVCAPVFTRGHGLETEVLRRAERWIETSELDLLRRPGQHPQEPADRLRR